MAKGDAVDQWQDAGGLSRVFRRRNLIALAGGVMIAWTRCVRAQEPGRTYRVGFLSPLPRDAPHVVALFDTLRRRGFVAGQNLQIVGHGFGLRSEQFAQQAARLVADKVDVIVCGGPAAGRAAQQATRTIPILVNTDNMVSEGLVRSMAHPGGNTTGVSIFASELDGKRQQLLTELVPAARRIAALADPAVTTKTELQALQKAGRSQGIEVAVYRVAKLEEIAPAIEAAHGAGAQALNVLASALLDAGKQLIIDRTAALKLPAIYQWPETAQLGGLAGYGPSIVQIYRELLSRLLVELLRGTKHADLPIEQPTKFELVINAKTAKALDLTVPALLLAQADEVIE